jgi:hypothetical protein
VFDDNAKTVVVLFLLHNQALHVFYFEWNRVFLLVEDQNCRFDQFQVLLVLLSLVNFNAWTFCKRCYSHVFWLLISFQHPNIGVEAFEVDVEDLLVVLHNDKELLEFDLIFVFVELHLVEDENSVLFY